MLRAGILTVVAALTLTAPAANAMPLLDLRNDPSPGVTLVWDGCGPYGHRGPFGGCRPGGQWGGWWANGVPPCPPGFHLGPYRHYCWRN